MPDLTNPSTVRVWQYIEAHPGCGQDEILAAARDEHWFPIGEAKRQYLHRLERKQNGTLGGGRARVPFEDISPEVAVKYMTGKVLSNLKHRHAVGTDDDGGYRVLRPIRIIGDAARLVAPMDEVRADVALRNLRIVARQHRDRLIAASATQRNAPPAPRAVIRALLTWLEADAKAYADRQAELEAER